MVYVHVLILQTSGTCEQIYVLVEEKVICYQIELEE